MLALQANREADLMTKSKKARIAVVVSVLVLIAPINVPAFALLKLVAMIVVFAGTIGIFLGTYIRKAETKKFVAILTERPQQVSRIHANVNVAYGVRSGTALVLTTTDGKTGSAPFLEADVSEAVSLLKAACPHAST